MRYLAIIIFILWTNISVAAQVLVTVGGDTITSLDLEKRIEAIKMVNPDLTSDNQLRNQILNSLINEKLFNNEAKRLKISVAKEEVEEKFKSMQADYGFSDIAIRNLMQNRSFWKQVKGQVLLYKLINIIFANKVKASDAEVREEQKVRKANIKEVTFKQVIFENFDIEKINNLRQKATNCQNLDQYAKELALGKPIQNSLLFNDLNSELQNIIKSLPDHTLSEAINFSSQKQVVMICHKHILNNPQDVQAIRNALVDRKINDEAQKYLAELKKRTYIEYTVRR